MRNRPTSLLLPQKYQRFALNKHKPYTTYYHNINLYTWRYVKYIFIYISNVNLILFLHITRALTQALHTCYWTFISIYIVLVSFQQLQLSTIYYLFFIEIFLQTLKKSSDTNTLRLRVVKTFRERVCRAVCRYPGPVAILRDIQKNIKGALSENVKSK